MAVNILTREDLQQFKTELLAEIKSLINASPSKDQKKWLKSWEVREMLGISRGTLQNLHTSGQLPGNLVGGLLFFDIDDIMKLMTSNKLKR